MSIVNLIKSHRRTLKFVPQYSFAQKKGDHGKVLVVGGSFEYTGAPFYAAYAAMRAGSDLTWIVCTEHAASPIKSYSPEIIVHPLLKHSGKDYTTEPVDYSGEDEEYFEYALRKLRPLIDRADAIVVGPGLGRDKMVLDLTERIINITREEKIPLVLDGDALFLVAHKMDILKGHDLAVCTPNGAELSRMYNSAFGEVEEEETIEQRCKKLADFLQGPVILAKHKTETISQSYNKSSVHSQSDASITLQLPDPRVVNITTKPSQRSGESSHGTGSGDFQPREDTSTSASSSSTAGQKDQSGSADSHALGHNTIRGLPTMAIKDILQSGSPKRMGGQGDVLAGVLGTTLAWVSSNLERKRKGVHLTRESGAQKELKWPLVDAAYLACTTTRLAANMTWNDRGRASSTMDILHNVPQALETIILAPVPEDQE